MAVEITVILDGTAGSMARVIAALKRFGLAFSGHHIEPIGDDRSRLVVNAEGSAVADELHDKLAEIKGVAEVVRIGSSGDSGGPSREPVVRPVAPGTSLEEFANRLVNEYPRILRHIDAFEEALPSNQDLSEELKRLGGLVGGKLCAREAAHQEASTLHEALENAVVPILDRIAEPEVVGSDIRVRLSIFTRRQVNTMDLVFGGEASRCDFLSGMIEGIVEGMPGLPDVRVEETTCRTNGDEYCLFRVNA